jgi:PhoH-like ATPase
MNRKPRARRDKSLKAALKTKVFVLDTNIMLSDADSLHAFQEHEVVIPLVALEELDRHKKRQDEVGRNARAISRRLDELREIGNLSIGVKLPTGGTLKVLPIPTFDSRTLPAELKDQSKVDNVIIAQAKLLSKEMEDGSERCILISKDINVRIKCDALGIKCQDYFHMRIADDTSELYKGVKNLIVEESVLADWYESREVYMDNHGLYPNEIVVMKTDPESPSAIGRFVEEGKPISRLIEYKDIFGLKPRNKEQIFSLNLLMDDNIKLVTLIGSSGVGKTLLALSTGLKKVLEEGKYERIVVTKPVQPVGKDIGFLPGTKEEKMDPWIAPIKDNLMFLFSHKKVKKDGHVHEFKRDPYVDKLIHDGKIEVEAITYLRGRSIPNTFMIIDEAQNLSMHELKTIITRVGDNTKIVLLGDIDQIDNIHVDAFTNGLTCAVEKFKEHGIAGHITLIKGERSPLATLASQIL